VQKQKKESMASFESTVAASDEKEGGSSLSIEKLSIDTTTADVVTTPTTPNPATATATATAAAAEGPPPSSPSSSSAKHGGGGAATTTATTTAVGPDDTPATPQTKKMMREGQVGHLTPAQEAALGTFKQQARPSDIEAAKYSVETVDQVCCRFLRARGFDVGKALILLGECQQKLTEMRAAYWASVDPNEALQCDLGVLKNFYPHVQSGFDRFNRPVLFEHTGGMNPSAVMQLTTKQRLINYHWWSMEKSLDERFSEAAARATSTAENPDGTTVHHISTCVVLDFQGMGMSHVSQKMLDQMKLYISLDNTCYPELLGKMLVINAPTIAVNTWGMVKRWLDPRTQSKIEILGSGPETLRRLHEFIAPDQLPRAYGGTAPDIFPRKANCELTSVPRSGKFQKTVAVPAGKTLTVDSYVTEGPVEITITAAAGPGRSPQGLCPPITATPRCAEPYLGPYLGLYLGHYLSLSSAHHRHPQVRLFPLPA